LVCHTDKWDFSTQLFNEKKNIVVVVVVFILSNFDFSDPPLNLATKNFTLKKSINVLT